ncbi:MAG: type 1 glutamine amidotransferase [Candidatus Schekmanbacteria bacterium]|nr:type 1 glutamine amidotransferase [Candidatus Schekmanbacteria bacterium]
MKVHVLQHVAFEGLGSMGPWLRRRGTELSVTRMFAEDPLPAITGIDLLIVLGGPMSVNDEAELPWLVTEKQLVRSAIENGTAVLGVCLGAQLIAGALGAPVFRNPVKEIGWFPVEAIAATGEACFRFPPSLTVFHWHGETFDLPPGAVQLARSQGCENQAFQLGQHVIGLQFHLETTPASTRLLMENCRDELVPGPFVQTEEELSGAPPAQYRAINEAMDEVLEYLTASAGRLHRGDFRLAPQYRPRASPGLTGICGSTPSPARD